MKVNIEFYKVFKFFPKIESYKMENEASYIENQGRNKLYIYIVEEGEEYIYRSCKIWWYMVWKNGERGERDIRKKKMDHKREKER